MVPDVVKSGWARTVGSSSLVPQSGQLQVSTSMPNLPAQLARLLTPRQRIQAVLLLGGLIVRALVQLVGVASIVPFISVVADPGQIASNELLQLAFEHGGFESAYGFLVAVGVASVLALTLSNSVAALTSWAQQRFVWNVQFGLSCTVFDEYLRRPYEFFVGRNTATLHQNVLGEVQAVVTGVLRPALEAVAQGLVIVTLVGLLVYFDPLLAAIVVGILGGAYSLLYLLIRQYQRRLGERRLAAHRQRYKTASEAFGGIKDVKVLGREQDFSQAFSPPSFRFARSNAATAIVVQLPRYLLETIAFGGILLIVVHYLKEGRDVGQILPVVSLYAFAGYRMMPALQSFFASVSGIRFQRSALDSLLEDLDDLDLSRSVDSPTEVSEVPFEASLRFEDVWFAYFGAPDPTLRGINLEIRKNMTLGLVGPSGGGKTTLVDVFLGLYSPSRGRITVDGTVLGPGSLRAWRSNVGYVPQQIFLLDDSVARNIAFGVGVREIDLAAVEHAAKVAHLHDFIMTLPEKYETVVGERGVRFSGGQRQRVGIARALYNDPDVLVFDEATSALDGATEGAVMEAIHGLAGRKTMVIIAHRLSTVRACDQIVLLDRGQVRGQGTYAQLAETSEGFKALESGVLRESG